MKEEVKEANEEQKERAQTPNAEIRIQSQRPPTLNPSPGTSR